MCIIKISLVPRPICGRGKNVFPPPTNRPGNEAKLRCARNGEGLEPRLSISTVYTYMYIHVCIDYMYMYMYSTCLYVHVHVLTVYCLSPSLPSPFSASSTPPPLSVPSTGQAKGHDSDVLLQPVSIFRDPFFQVHTHTHARTHAHTHTRTHTHTHTL